MKKSLIYSVLISLVIIIIYWIYSTSWKDTCLHCARSKTLFSSSNSVTLVTALYDIGRIKQGRSIEDYLRWMEQTLQLDCPFIIYTSPALISRIRRMRHGRLFGNTIFIERDYIPLGEFADLIESRVFPSFRPHMQHPEDITNKNKLYSIINHAKMVWMSDAIALNPFHTEYFFWIDAGFSRFLQQEHYTRPFPANLSRLKTLLPKNQAFVSAASASKEDLDLTRELKTEDVVGTNKNFVRGNFWGGHSEAVRKLAAQTLSIFFDMLARDTIDNEQVSLFLAFRKQPELVSLRKTESETDSFNHIAGK